MKLLIDTNIFLEVLLEQARANEAKELLAKTDTHDLTIVSFDTDFDKTTRGRKAPSAIA